MIYHKIPCISGSHITVENDEMGTIEIGPYMGQKQSLTGEQCIQLIHALMIEVGLNEYKITDD